MNPVTELQRGAVPHPDIQSLAEVNRAVLKPLSRPGKGWWALFGIAAMGVGVFFSAWGYQIVKGIGANRRRRVGYGVDGDDDGNLYRRRRRGSGALGSAASSMTASTGCWGFATTDCRPFITSPSVAPLMMAASPPCRPTVPTSRNKHPSSLMKIPYLAALPLRIVATIAVFSPVKNLFTWS